MKALALPQPGDHRTLQLMDFPIPEPAPHEVRVKVVAVSLNPADYKQMASHNPRWHYPFIPGLDAAGVIDAVGAAVQQWQPGDRVAFHTDLRRNGIFAEYALAAEQALGKVPESVSFEAAASLPCAGLTALHALAKLNLPAGEKVLILGGAGGVGSLAVQLAKMQGLEVLATASDKNQAYLTDLGVDHPLDYHHPILPHIHRINGGRGLNGVFDTVGSRANPQVFSYLGFGGNLVSIVDVPPLPNDFLPRALSFHAFMLGTVYSLGSPEQQIFVLGESLAKLLDWVADGRLVPQVHQTIHWRDIPAGLDQLQDGHVTGKIVARVGD